MNFLANTSVIGVRQDSNPTTSMPRLGPESVLYLLYNPNLYFLTIVFLYIRLHLQSYAVVCELCKYYL